MRRNELLLTCLGGGTPAVAAVTALLLAAPLLVLWLGAAYAKAVLELLQILIVVYAVFSTAAPAWHLALGPGDAGPCALIALTAGLLDAGLIIPLGLAAGLNGAAAANAAYVLTLVLIPYLLVRLRTRRFD